MMESLKSQKESSLLEIIPIPIAGLMLALATNGNMLKVRSEYLRYAFGFAAFILFAILLLKAVLHFKNIKKEFENVAIASVIPTFSMGVMVLSTYVLPFSRPIASVMWYGAIVLHVILMVVFTKTYVINFKKETVLPSWYIVYVGIVVATVTGKQFNPLIGKICFYFGFVAYLILIPVILNRVYRVGKLKEAMLPTKVILTAPGSLCLAGYLSGFENKQTFMLMFLFVISQVFFLVVLTALPKLLKLQFYPSFSAFTFPMAITALSMKLYVGHLNTVVGSVPKWIEYIALFEEILAVVICLYVLYKYVKFIGSKFPA